MKPGKHDKCVIEIELDLNATDLDDLQTEKCYAVTTAKVRKAEVKVSQLTAQQKREVKQRKTRRSLHG